MPEANYFTIQANPHADQLAMINLSKYLEIFDLWIYAEDRFTDAQMRHAATVLAELLDNDEDGAVDDAALLTQLQNSGFIMPMFNRENSAAMKDFMRNTAAKASVPFCLQTKWTLPAPVIGVQMRRLKKSCIPSTTGATSRSTPWPSAWNPVLHG